MVTRSLLFLLHCKSTHLTFSQHLHCSRADRKGLRRKCQPKLRPQLRRACPGYEPLTSNTTLQHSEKGGGTANVKELKILDMLCILASTISCRVQVFISIFISI